MSSNELKYITLNCVDSSDPDHFWFIIPSEYLVFTKKRQIMMVNGSGGYRINSLFLRKTNFGYLYRFSKKCFFYCKLYHLYKPTILSEDFVVNIRFLKEKN